MDAHATGDRVHKVGSKWHHTFASGHQAQITKILETDYMIYVQPPAEGGTPFHTTARSLRDAIARANRWVAANSTMADWQLEDAGPFA
jgi:hypothetical protein